MRMINLRMGCLYSYGCRMAREKGVNEILSSFIKQKRERRFFQEIVQTALQELQSYSAYRLIATSKNMVDIFDEAVIRSYWLGEANPKSADLRNLNHNFATLEKINFFKKISGLDSEKVRSLLNCLISWGEVIGLNSDKIEVSETGLMLMAGKIVLSGREREVEVGFLEKKTIKKGSILSIHIGSAREIIDSQQTSLLDKRTLEALEAIKFE
ncbi:MAG: DUF6390 family protein [bacterium]|nr:DUF6390 family protein [bacterium]